MPYPQIKDLREDQNLSQRQIAEILHAHKATYARMEKETAMDIIEELFFENIDLNPPSCEQSAQYAEAMRTITDIEDSLAERLEGSDQKQYLRLVDAYSDLLGVMTVENFVNGFRIGARFVLDTFVTDPERILKDPR